MESIVVTITKSQQLSNKELKMFFFCTTKDTNLNPLLNNKFNKNHKTMQKMEKTFQWKRYYDIYE